jgi:hypothetical protein
MKSLCRTRVHTDPNEVSDDRPSLARARHKPTLYSPSFAAFAAALEHDDKDKQTESSEQNSGREIDPTLDLTGHLE